MLFSNILFLELFIFLMIFECVSIKGFDESFQAVKTNSAAYVNKLSVVPNIGAVIALAHECIHVGRTQVSQGNDCGLFTFDDRYWDKYTLDMKIIKSRAYQKWFLRMKFTVKS